MPMTSKSLKILYVCSEVSPLVKTGGLGDVSYALPRTLRSLGHDVRVAMPCYGTIPFEARGAQVAMCIADMGWTTAYGALRQTHVPGTSVPLYLVEHDGYFDRPSPYGGPEGEYWDNVERFSFFNLALLDGIANTGWTPDLVHCHDWHAALIPAHIKTRLARHPVWGGMPTLFTIHNLGYQGRYAGGMFPKTGLSWEYFTPEHLEFYAGINLMKAGIVFADALSTVSRRYAVEIQTPEYGHGLDGVLRTRAKDLYGIVNGVDYDKWNPACDPRIAATFTADAIEGKAVCKSDLQRHCDFSKSQVPLFGMVSRLTWQKGIDLLVDMIDAMLEQDVQLVVLGNGDAYYQDRMAQSARRHPKRMRLFLGYDDVLAHRIYAGSDFFLMPSHTEPCGLSQLYSLAYGTLPIVRRTGGLADTVQPVTRANLARNKATGFAFSAATATALSSAVNRAIALYDDKKTLAQMRRAAMLEDFSWKHSSQEYERLYRKVVRKHVS